MHNLTVVRIKHLLRNYLVELSSIKCFPVVLFKVFDHQLHGLLAAKNVIQSPQNLRLVLLQRADFLSNHFFNYLTQLNTDGLFNNCSVVRLENHLGNFFGDSELHPLLNGVAVSLAWRLPLLNFRVFLPPSLLLLVLHFTFIIYIEK
jgi:hypothetical protein